MTNVMTILILVAEVLLAVWLLEVNHAMKQERKILRSLQLDVAEMIPAVTELKAMDLNTELDAMEVDLAETREKAEEAVKKVDELKEKLGTLLSAEGEVKRYDELLQKVNDQMEVSLKLETEWNEQFTSIMGFTGATGGNKQ